MDMNESKKRIDELVQTLNYHAHLYYVEDTNEISDYEYDMMQRELKELEAQYPQFIRKDKSEALLIRSEKTLMIPNLSLSQR